MRARAGSSHIISIALLDRAHNSLCFSDTSAIPLQLRCSFDIVMSKRPSSSQRQSKSTNAKSQKTLSGYFGASRSTSTTSTLGDTTTTSIAASSANTESSSSSSEYKIFCDLDGVLVDFNAGVKKICNGLTPEELPNKSKMWSAISRADRFYDKLPWTEDGKVLWEELKNHSTTPDILTGVATFKSCAEEKFAWCKRELAIPVNHVDMAGKKSTHELVSGTRQYKVGIVNVITCWSKNKHYESKANHVLIDDRLSLKHDWEKQGGIFIHHTSTESTISMLRERGVLESRIADQASSDDE